MMEKEWLIKAVRVECHAGYKGDESPRVFIHLGKPCEIVEILDRWYEEGRTAPALRREYFRVKTAEGETILLRHTPEHQIWELCRTVPVSRHAGRGQGPFP